MHDVIPSTMARMPLDVSDVLPGAFTLHVFAAFLCAVVAASKGRSAIGWFIVGLFFGCCPGFVVLFFMPDATAKSADRAPVGAHTAPPPPPAPLPPTEPPQWYYEEAEEAAGPVSKSSLVALIRAGAVTAETLVWRKGMDDWEPIEDVDDLRDLT